jgi:hypothetical protein
MQDFFLARVLDIWKSIVNVQRPAQSKIDLLHLNVRLYTDRGGKLDALPKDLQEYLKK